MLSSQRDLSMSFVASNVKNYCCGEWQHSRLHLRQMYYSSEQCFSREESIQGLHLKSYAVSGNSPEKNSQYFMEM